MSAERTLVTGATGFLGRAVVRSLVEKGWEVDAVTSSQNDGEPGSRPGVTWHRADLLDRSSIDHLLAEVDAPCLMHLAWASNRGVYRSPENFRWAEAGMALVERFLEGGGRRGVCAGSSAEYDWKSGVCREGVTPLAGGGAYGAAKRAFFESAQGLCEARGASCAWARIFFLFGPHEPEGRLVPAVARALIEGAPVRCSHGRQVRDYLFVDDAADALVEILRSDLTGPINIGSGEGMRIRDLVRELARRVGSTDRIEWGAVPAAPEDDPLVIADVGRLRDELGWTPSIGFSRGLDETLAWWRRILAEQAGAANSATGC